MGVQDCGTGADVGGGGRGEGRVRGAVDYAVEDGWGHEGAVEEEGAVAHSFFVIVGGIIGCSGAWDWVCEVV